MSHISLYRKYRPATFAEVAGQEHVTRTLIGAIVTGRIAHAYLFAGSRGTGKTSTAKLLAKALNCVQGPTESPCGQCESCRAISAATSMDVIEMDAASNRGIDDIRDIRDKVAFATVEGKYRVYILDEAHMLTKEASNAFLKILEEPPAHVIFVLCTTEAHKVLPTIQSRCQCFEFRRPDVNMILNVLERIAAAEGIDIDQAGLMAIARGSGGAFRDAIGALDQLATYCDKKISLADVLAMLGAVESELLFEAVDIAAAGDVRSALLLVDRLAGHGRDLGQFAQELIGHLRYIFLTQQLDGQPEGVVSLPEDDLQRLKGQARTMAPAAVLRFVELLSEAQSWMKQGSDPRLQLELAFIKATQPQVDLSTKSLLYRVEQLERRLLAGVGPAAAPAAPQTREGAAAGADYSDGGHRFMAPPQAGADSGGANRMASPQAGADSGGANRILASLDAEAPLSSGAGQTQVEQETPPAETPAAIELSLDKLTRAWSIILGEVKKRKIPLYTVLMEGRPVRLEGNALTIGFPSGSTFHKSQVEKPDNGALITGVLKEMTGSSLRVRAVVAAGAVPSPRPVPEIKEDDSVPTTNDVIAMIKNEFGAEEI